MAGATVACGPQGEVDVVVEYEATPFPDGSTPEPAPFGRIEAAYVGVSGNYPYVLFFDKALTCDQLEGRNGETIPPGPYNSLLVLVGGWDEGTYPIYDIVGNSGAYTLDGNAIGYVAKREGNLLLSVDYARGGVFQVDSINQLLSRATGDFSLDFDWGNIEGSYQLTEYCDVY